MPSDGTGATHVAVVTGGARGIGASIVDKLLSEDWVVIVFDVNRSALDTMSERTSRANGRLEYRELSITDRPAVEEAATEIAAQHGPISALVNNAGRTLPSTFLTQTDEDWDRIIDVNLRGTFVVSQVFAQQMSSRRSGSIVNISSVSAHGVRTGPPAYAAAKAGVEGLARLMAVELGPLGIRVNTVVVGTTATAGLLSRKTAAQLNEMEQSTLTGELGDPADIANVVAFLCSDRSHHVTGQLISVSGGQWMP